MLSWPMPPWFEREQSTPFDHSQIDGRRDLSGDELASKYRQEWVEGKKYPIIHFPSQVEREITAGGKEGKEPQIHIFASVELPYHCTRDEAYHHIIPAAQERRYILGREHESRLRIANPHTGRSYALTFDNEARHISNIEIFPQYAMELVTGEIRAVLPPLKSQEQKELEAIAPVKFFTPDSDWTWYATEYDGDDLFFGLVSGYEVELGYFSRTELETVRGGLNLPIEHDIYYKPQALKEIQEYERKLKR